jgi:hypothetical protein
MITNVAAVFATKGITNEAIMMPPAIRYALDPVLDEEANILTMKKTSVARSPILRLGRVVQLVSQK